MSSCVCFLCNPCAWNKKTQQKIIKHIGYTTWNTSPRKRPTNPNQQSLYKIKSNGQKGERKKQIKRKELSLTGVLNTSAKIGEVGDRVFSSVEVVVSQQLSHSTACGGCERTSMENAQWCRGGWTQANTHVRLREIGRMVGRGTAWWWAEELDSGGGGYDTAWWEMGRERIWGREKGEGEMKISESSNAVIIYFLFFLKLVNPTRVNQQKFEKSFKIWIVSRYDKRQLELFKPLDVMNDHDFKIWGTQIS